MLFSVVLFERLIHVRPLSVADMRVGGLVTVSKVMSSYCICLFRLFTHKDLIYSCIFTIKHLHNVGAKIMVQICKKL